MYLAVTFETKFMKRKKMLEWERVKMAYRLTMTFSKRGDVPSARRDKFITIQRIKCTRPFNFSPESGSRRQAVCMRKTKAKVMGGFFRTWRIN